MGLTKRNRETVCFLLGHRQSDGRRRRVLRRAWVLPRAQGRPTLSTGQHRPPGRRTEAFSVRGGPARQPPRRGRVRRCHPRKAPPHRRAHRVETRPHPRVPAGFGRRLTRECHQRAAVPADGRRRVQRGPPDGPLRVGQGDGFRHGTLRKRGPGRRAGIRLRRR